MSMPNILLLHAHDMGRYNSVYGYPAVTPNMQRLADGGLTFTDAHCAAPTCSPSRAALLTGQTAHQSGMFGLAHRGFALNDPAKHLARLLRAHGYHATLCGHQHEFEEGLENEFYDLAFNAFPRTGDRALDDNVTSDCAVRQLAAYAAADTGNGSRTPWFMWAGYFYPHRPFLKAPINEQHSDDAALDAAAINRLPPPPDALPPTLGTRRDMADYYASVAHTDAAIGRVLDALERTGQDRDTVVILTTDHGIAFPLMKCRLTAHGTGVTLIVRAPGHTRAGARSEALVSHLDLYPTLCELAGIPVPPWAIGRSLSPLFREDIDADAHPVREDTFAEVNFHAAAEPMRCVRTKDFNYIKLFDSDPRPPLANVDQGRAKDDWLAADDGPQPRPLEQLYDLKRDPFETRNVAALPEYAATLDLMRRRLEDWMCRTSDPLLGEPLVLPLGAFVNSREDIDPVSPPIST